MSQEPKKGMSLKTKIYLVLAAVIILLGIGFYLGMRLQRAYNSFIFNAGQNMIGFSFWAVIILVVLLICLLIYLFIKLRHKHK